MTQRRIRSIVFKLHAWLGLHVFAVMALLFLTGTVLVFVYQVEAALVGSERLPVPRPMEERASFGTLYETTRAYAPDAVVVEITRSESPWIADRARIFVPGGGFRYLWFGGEGETVSREASTTDLQRVVHDIHASFLTGHMTGGIAVGLFSILLGGFLISGLVSYRRFWRGFLRLPPRHLGPRAWWGGLHRLLALWLSPFYLSPQHDAGYDVADYCDVDPRFGTLADADALIARAHELGLKVLVDIVPNHSSNEH